MFEYLKIVLLDFFLANILNVISKIMIIFTIKPNQEGTYFIKRVYVGRFIANKSQKRKVV